MITATDAWDDAALASLIAGATLLGADLKAGLFVNTPAIQKGSVIGDFTEPAYAGYARQLVVMGPPFRDPANGISSISAGLLWNEGGAITPVIINGIFYIFGAGPALLGAEYFQTPIPLNNALDAFTTILDYVQSSGFQGYTTIVR